MVSYDIQDNHYISWEETIEIIYCFMLKHYTVGSISAHLRLKKTKLVCCNHLHSNQYNNIINERTVTVELVLKVHFYNLFSFNLNIVINKTVGFFVAQLKCISEAFHTNILYCKLYYKIFWPLYTSVLGCRLDILQNFQIHRENNLVWKW